MRGSEELNTTFILCNCYELDSNYNHTVDFNSRESQLQWFLDRQTDVLTENMYQRKSENVIRVDKSIESLDLTNYVVAKNLDNGLTYFYFIVDKEYVNDYTTTLYLQLDVIQTYLFDIRFTSSLIDRQHVSRWFVDDDGNKTPYTKYEMEDEELDTGEYEIKKITTLYNYNNKGSYVITSSEPLGVVDNNDSILDDDIGTGSGYTVGYMDARGLWALKSFEGYCSEPYQDIYGNWTVGYGVTLASYEDVYLELSENCTEVLASEFLGQIAYNFSSQVADLCREQLGGDWLNQNKLNALTCYAYQYGVYGLQQTSLWNLICTGASDEEVYQHYKSITEYASRRQQEAEMFIGNYPSEYLITDHSTHTYVTDNNGMGHIPQNYNN